MQFDLPKERSSIIKVIGVGGGGSNAVNYMFNKGIQGVNFVVCNTDQQALDMSPVPNKIALGPSLTEGRGAGSKPEVGKRATEESIEEIKQILSVNTKMVFITAGMGGGTGTGGAPILAQIAREMDILTVAIVTTPFRFEGPRRIKQAEEGIEELREYVDALIVVSNDKLKETFNSLAISEAFGKADDILAIGAKGIAEIITISGFINVDFEDVKTVMSKSGIAIMGHAHAEGEHRAIRAVEAALSSPLLNDNEIRGAKNILLNISFGNSEVSMDEVAQITDYVHEEAGEDADLIWGNCFNPSLEDKISVTIIATGFETDQEAKKMKRLKDVPIVRQLDDIKEEKEKLDEPEMEKNEELILYDESEDTGSKKTSQIPFLFEMNDQDEDSEEKITKRRIEPDFSSLKKDRQVPDKPEQFLNGREESNEEDKPKKWNALPDRIQKLRKMSMKLKNPSIVNDMEKKPAYLRRNIELEDTPHSSESNVSTHTLTEHFDEEEGEKRVEIRKNNSFLHDNVD